ncbi:MAG: hypothetical protein OYH76_00530 [Defluviicoccus sp.]|nr:hypothetical protein [Defluviicoccus sp.]MDE0274349.1 hypothetical protein [Defluviicoccus sp.]
MSRFFEDILRSLGLAEPVEPSELVRLGYAAALLLVLLCAVAAFLLWLAL